MLEDGVLSRFGRIYNVAERVGGGHDAGRHGAYPMTRFDEVDRVW